MLTIKAGNYTLATYEYAGNNGKLLKLIYGNGDYEEYVYDNLERLVSTKLNGVTEYTVKYDNNGRLYSLTEDGATHIYEYDSLDRLIRAWQEDGNGNAVLAVENYYDDLGRAKGSTYVVGDREMSYEINYKANSNLVNYISMPVAEMQSNISYTYDAFERVTRKQNSFFSALNYYEEYGYYNYTDADGAQHTTSLVSSLKLGGNVPNAPTTVYTYTYDSLGNIKTVKKNGSLISQYSYDSLGQLISESDNVNDMVYSYTYDKSGNIIKKTAFDYITSESYDINYTYNNSTWGDMLTNYNGTAISYDEIGNPTNWRNINSMTWEGRELQTATVTSGPRVTYEYNSSGIRTKKTLGSAMEYSYTLDGTKILSETVTQLLSGSNYTLYYLYDASGSVQGFIYNDTYYYFQKNLQGDVIRILNSNGTVVTEYTYDAWGNVLTTTGSLASTVGRYNPFRYRSYYYDSETGFYYLQSRYYDPTVGRFLNADVFVSTGQGLTGNNMFAYCGNNPVIRVDANGELWEIIVIVAMIVGCSMLSSCGGPDTETLVDTPADPAPDLYRFDYDEAVYEACQIAFDAMENYEKVTGYRVEYYIYIFKYVDSPVYDGARYYITGARTSGGSARVDIDTAYADDPHIEIVAMIHTHPTDKRDNTDYIFNEKDDEDSYKCNEFVVDAAGKIWMLPADAHNFTNEKYYGKVSASVPGSMATIGWYIPVSGQVC